MKKLTDAELTKSLETLRKNITHIELEIDTENANFSWIKSKIAKLAEQLNYISSFIPKEG